MAVAELKLLQKLNEYEFGVELWMMRSGINQNKWDYQNLEQHYLSFVGTPILCAFPHGQIADGHNLVEKRDANGEPYYSFIGRDGLEQIVGTLSDDPNDFSLVEKDGETWLVAKGRLFTFYAHELVSHLKETGSMSVSVETEVLESHVSEEDPTVEVFTEWIGLGVTVLHETVAPAIPGANIKALQALASEFNEMKLKVASMIKQTAEEVGGEPDESDDVGEEDEKDDIGEPDEPDDPDDAKDYDDGLDDDDDEPSDGEETQKPQNQNLSKGEITMQVFTKKQVAELAPKFDGYTVLAAGQDDAGIRVCLMSADGTTAVYTMDSIDDSYIDPKKFVTVNTSVSFKFDEESSIDVASYELTDALGASVVKANAELESVSGELKSAKETIESMKAAEMKRRVSAAKAKAVETLAKFNANRTEKVNEAVLDGINEAIDNGEYSDCLNGEGEWCGEDAVCEAVLAQCAKEVMKYDQAQVARNSSHYVWSEGHRTSGEGEGVEALIAQWRAKKI